MATQIFNDKACLRIVNNGNTILIYKHQIKTVDTIRNEIVRLDIGEGALKNIYLRFSEVTLPEGLRDVNHLREYISELLIQDGWSTEQRQDVEIGVLQQIYTALDAIRNQGSGMGLTSTKEPLRIDESNPNVIYKGWALPDSNTNEEKWAIQKISRIDNVIIYEWADGNDNYDNIWDNRYELPYFPSGYLPK